MIIKKALLRTLVAILPFYNMAGWAMDGDVKVDFDDVNDGTNRASQVKSYSGQHKTTQTVRIWLELPDYDTCPRTFRALACQEHLLKEGYKRSDYVLPVDLTFYVRNDTDYPMRIGDEEFTCGYYCLEIDVRLANGKIFAARRKEGAWTRNFISEEEIRGEKIHRRLLSMNPRLWTGLPSEVAGDKVYLRPRFAFFSFVNEGRHYKSIDDLVIGKESSTWHGSRDGELIGDWLPVPADRFKSWMHGDSGKEKGRRK